MNYYPHHIGDYVTATAHLSMIEDGAYRRLLDLYYSREEGLPGDLEDVCRLVRAMKKNEKKSVEVVLHEFFFLADGMWKHSRCDSEIEKATASAMRSKVNGSKGGRPKQAKQKQDDEETQRVFLGSENATQKKATQKPPITNNQEPNSSVTNVTGGKPPPTDPEEIIFGYGVPLLTNAGTADKQARSFLGGLRKQHGDALLIDKLRDCLKAKPLQPLEWLAAALPPKGAAKASRHSGFENIDYHAGIGEDGRF